MSKVLTCQSTLKSSTSGVLPSINMLYSPVKELRQLLK